jgi:hypothetical protein
LTYNKNKKNEKAKNDTMVIRMDVRKWIFTKYR